MFERFSEGAIKVIMLAQEEARRLGHNFVGTEMLLLGIIGHKSNTAAELLLSSGVGLKNTREAVANIIGRGSGFVAVEIPFTPRGKRAMECSWAAAKGLNSELIGPEHLFMGILSEIRMNTKSNEKIGIAGKALGALGVDLNNLESVMLKKLGYPEELYPPEPRTILECTLYQSLQVDPTAEYDLIKLAYEFLSNKYKDDQSKLEEINLAWSILSDENKRAEYDQVGRYIIP